MANPKITLGIEVESPERGTSEDLERKARPEGERPKYLRSTELIPLSAFVKAFVATLVKKRDTRHKGPGTRGKQ